MSEPVPLAATVRGHGPAVVLLHGFAQDARAMDRLQDRLSHRFRTVAVDLPGHGRSAMVWAAEYRSQTVRALCQVLDRMEIAEAAWVGYSFGARLAAWAARDQPSRCWALVLESMAPLLPEPERQARLEADLALARRIRAGPISDFVATWEGQAVFASQKKVAAADLLAQHRMRLSQDPEGLAEALSGGGQVGSGLSLEQLAGLRVPTLLLAGSEDLVYREHLKRMEEVIPGAETRLLSGAGHNLHLEAGEETSQQIGRFLIRVGQVRSQGDTMAPSQRRAR